MASIRLKGCPYENIERTARMFLYAGDAYFNIYIESESRRISKSVADTYSIKDCLSLILSNGDLLDAVKRSEGVELDMNDKLIYHRQLALPYIENIVKNKIITKLTMMKMRKS
jgi:hypothetical protein